MSEAKRREVLQILKDYRSFHSAYGDAMPLDETHVVDSNYGPAGMILAGRECPRGEESAPALPLRVG